MVLKLFISFILSLNLYSLEIAPSTMDLRSLTILVSEQLHKNILISSDLKNFNIDIYFPNDVSDEALFHMYKKALLSKDVFLNDYDTFFMVEKLKNIDKQNRDIKLELTIIELDNDKFKELGMNASVNADLKSVFNLGKIFNEGTIFGTGAFFDIDLILSSLETNDIINVISKPKILVRNGQSTTLTIGDTVSVLKSSVSEDTTDSKVRNTYEQKDVGLEITAKPVIRDDGKIDIFIDLNMENLKDYQEGLISTTKRSIKSNFCISNGESIKIGGLVQTLTLDKTSKIPLLGDIPVLQYLFRYESSKTINNSLSILIKVDLV
jgi:general secretion pathway protein D